MRKHILIAGMLIAAAFVFAIPSKADSVDYTLTGPGASLTFTLPQTLTGSSTIILHNVEGTLFGGSYSFRDLTISISSFMGASDLWAFGSIEGQSTSGNLAIYATNLFTLNPDGSVTLNGGTSDSPEFFQLSSMNGPSVLTATVVHDAPVGTPEPATLALLGVGGLVLAGLRRKAA
jgi:hypothetical protein